MSNYVAETYNPNRIGVDGNYTTSARTSLGGFSCDVAGTLTLSSGGTTFLNAMPVVAGGYYPLTYSFGNGAVVQLGGGASGCLGTLA